MSPYEYKTVALPSLVRGKRRRRQSEADLVAEVVGETIQSEAVDGWEYMRAENLEVAAAPGLFSKRDTQTAYVVLIFRRAVSSAWRPEDAPAARRRATEAMPREEPVAAARPTATVATLRVDDTAPRYEAPETRAPDLRTPNLTPRDD